MSQTPTKLDFALHLDFGSILTNPILDIAARVWDEDRYAAFKVCYRSMRRIDDLVDHRRADGTPMTSDEIGEIRKSIEAWVTDALTGKATDPFTIEFLKTITEFKLPLWPWERLCQAMIYDLSHNGFTSLHAFLRYCEGAAISPAAVFMHLCGLSGGANNRQVPLYDIRLAARPLALFSYFVHVMRDFEKDQREGLNYFADDILRRCQISRTELRELATNRETTLPLRNVMREYCRIADFYRLQARQVIDRTLPLLAPRYQLSLELIYALYSQIFERLDPSEGRFDTTATNPPPSDVEARIQLTINEFQATR